MARRPRVQLAASAERFVEEAFPAGRRVGFGACALASRPSPGACRSGDGLHTGFKSGRVSACVLLTSLPTFSSLPSLQAGPRPWSTCGSIISWPSSPCSRRRHSPSRSTSLLRLLSPVSSNRAPDTPASSPATISPRTGDWPPRGSSVRVPPPPPCAHALAIGSARGADPLSEQSSPMTRRTTALGTATGSIPSRETASPPTHPAPIGTRSRSLTPAGAHVSFRCCCCCCARAVARR